MKKFLFTFLLLATAGTALADNYFTAGVNDSIRINPIFLNNGFNVCVRSSFEARLDNINLTLTYPTGITVSNLYDGYDMSIPYVNSLGHDTIYNAHFITNSDYTSAYCSIVEPGYFLVSGIWMCYGTVKWEAGTHDDMFDLLLLIDGAFRSGNITISGVLSSTHDWRGITLTGGAIVYRQILLYVGYMRGDVNGDEHLDISDITRLIAYLQNDSGLDEFQQAAADMNDDGVLNVTDVTLLTSYINNL